MNILEHIATALDRFIHRYTYAHKFASSERADRLRESVSNIQEEWKRDLEITSTIINRMDILEQRVDELYHVAGGVIWETARGTRRHIVDMSSGHLENIIAGNYGSASARNRVMLELDRRKADKSYREAEKAIADSNAELERERAAVPDAHPLNDKVGLIIVVSIIVICFALSYVRHMSV